MLFRSKSTFTIVLSPEARERVNFQNAFIIKGSRLRDFCDQLSQAHGIQIDHSFLDRYQSDFERDYWHITELKDSENKRKMVDMLKQ